LNNNYVNQTDEELIIALRDGDSGVYDYILEKYKNMVRIRARSMFIPGSDDKDTIQEGMIGLFKAIRDYDPGRDASFRTFAELCVSRQIVTAIESSKRKKHSFLNDYVSLDASYMNESEEASLLERLTSLTDRTPEEMIVDRDFYARLVKRTMETLSELEQSVFQLLMSGFSYSEIARILGRDEKSTDNAIQRIKTKIKKVLPTLE